MANVIYKDYSGYIKLSDFLKSKAAFGFGLFFVIMCLFTSFKGGLQIQNFSMSSMFGYLGVMLPFFIPALLMTLWFGAELQAAKSEKGHTEKGKNKPDYAHHIFARFKAAFGFMLLLLVLTLPYLFAELMINSFLVAGLLLSSYFITAVNVAVYIALCLLAFGLPVNPALKTIFAFLFVVAFNALMLPVTQPFYLGFFSGYDVVLLIMAAVASLVLAAIIVSVRFSLTQKIMQAICLAVILISVNLITKPFADYMFAELSLVKTFTLQDNAAEIFAELPNKTELSLYVPRYALDENFKNTSYAKVMAAYLRKVAAAGDGNITFTDYTGRYSDGEFAVVVSGKGEDITLPLPSDYKRGEFEDTLLRAILAKAGYDRKVLGLASSLPVEEVKDKEGKTLVPRWAFLKQLALYYDIVLIDFAIDFIPAKVDVLLLINPVASDEKEAARFTAAFDSFIRQKGKALIFADILAENAKAYPDLVKGGYAFADKLLKPFGLQVSSDKVAVNTKQAMQVVVPDKEGNPEEVPFIARFAVDDTAFNKGFAWLDGIKTVNFTTSGVLQFSAPDFKGMNLLPVPLITVTDETADAKLLANLSSPKVLTDKVEKQGTPSVIAAEVLSGKSVQDKDGKAVDIIVFADSDMLYNQFWLNIKSEPIADNGKLVLGAVDKLSGRKAVKPHINEAVKWQLKESEIKAVLIASSLAIILLFFGVWIIAFANRKRKHTF